MTTLPPPRGYRPFRADSSEAPPWVPSIRREVTVDELADGTRLRPSPPYAGCGRRLMRNQRDRRTGRTFVAGSWGRAAVPLAPGDHSAFTEHEELPPRSIRPREPEHRHGQS
ncbi:hypothetical protein Krad_2732 [Kineococcus radiotolerans SRS30216 = ATCC BAA-149]|uniref:Uncharacterized protein n=1 Tax=Kineococcus radiotolerans (strain ATCC BAA-149 / DSM 14245 / SRS30216) TaxID=266940 RepID=A6WBL5_KINRD|nr:hypothetical protein Krad_2732 [Kineococcus radiotolerans SRS30216 = ATCC BAA-149]